MKARFLRQMTRVVCLLYFCAAALLEAQPKQFRPAPDYVQLGKPDQKEGAHILEQFRSRGLYPGQHYLEFTLAILPRRGAERDIPGQLWGNHDERGNITRIVLFPGIAQQESRLLVRTGPENSAWSFSPGSSQGAQPISNRALFERLADSELTAFDLEMPFLFWKEFIFEGVSKVRGRPAHVFLLYPPTGLVPPKESLTAVRLYLDTEYNAVVQFQELGPEAQVTKTMSVLDLKKIEDQWIVKSIDYRNEITRDKCRFTVRAAADNLEFSPALFDPATLGDSIEPPPADRIVKIAP